MVRYIQITQVPPERLALWRSWLSPQRRKRAGRMLDDGRRSAARDWPVSAGGGAALPAGGGGPTIRRTGKAPDGRPVSQHQPQPWAGGLRRGGPPVGLDVELVRPAPRRVWEHLSPEERSHAADDAAFFRLWTAKEALLKCRGGRVGAAAGAGVLPDAGGLRLPGYAFFPVQLPEGWTGTLCLAEKRT